jgi:hypothetical protein
LLLPSWQAFFRINTALGSVAPRFMVNGHYYAAHAIKVATQKREGY